jgi:hypothetical protein
LGNPAGRGYNPRTEVRRMGRPGPTNYNPFSRFTAPRTPGPLGRNDAADPGILTSRGETPGSLGLNDDAAYDVARMVDPMDFDYLVNHYESKSHLVESVRLADLHLKEKHGLWSKQSIWGVGGAIVFRVSNLSEDLDGSARAYHPPTDASWSGYGHGRGKDSLANAVGNPGVTKYAHSKKEEDWALTAGCQLFRDLHKAKGLEPKATAASQPAAGKSPAPNQASADKAANDAKDALDAIFKKYGVTKLIKNSETPSIAYGMVADVSPKGHLGEVSRKMMDDLGFAGATPSGDYIVVLFPQNVSDADIGKEKEVSVIQSDAKAAFEAWTWKGRSGIELIKELFPTPEQYHRAQKDFANAKKYLTGYIDQLMLKLQ